MFSIPDWARVFEKLHDEQMNHFWRPPLLTKFLKDTEDWPVLPDEVRKTIKTILHILTKMETEVIDGIEKIVGKIGVRIIAIMMTMQEAMEGIHTRSYHIIDSVLDHPEIHEEMVERRMELLSWNTGDVSVSESLIHLVFSEGILLNNLFPIFFLLETKGLLPMTCTVNKEVLSDENLHTKSATTIYNVLTSRDMIERLSQEKVYELCSRYVAVDDAASESLYGSRHPFFLNMNPENSKIYTRLVANTILQALGYEPLYPKAENPYKFVDQSLLNTLEFFFDKEVVSYGLDHENPYIDESDDE